jgi:predicted amidohydrolase
MIKVGFAQFSPVRFNVEQNIAALKVLLSGVKADVLVLPELANSGYMYAAPGDLAPFTEAPDGSGPFLSALKDVAGAVGGVIVTGFAEKSAGRLYNSAAAVDNTGVIQVYRKTHLFSDENDLFTPGDTGFRVFEYRQARIGMMVCFDWFFPEAARSLALNGAQIIAHPANLVLPYCQLGMVTRSLENVVYSITCNRYGAEQVGQKSLRFTGCSQILDIKGKLLFQAPAEGDCVHCTEIDPAIADNKKINAHNDLFADRRPDMYSL